MNIASINAVDSFKPKRPIEYIDNFEKFNVMCGEIGKHRVIGLDVETTIYESPRRICTIQLSTQEKNWVVDALKLDWTDGIRNILENANIVKIIHNASFEKNSFKNYGISINSVVDTLLVSRRLRGMKAFGGHSLEVVCKRELNILMDKSCQCSDWTKRPLTKAQILYGALDSEVLIDLYSKFKQECSDSSVLA